MKSARFLLAAVTLFSAFLIGGCQTSSNPSRVNTTQGSSPDDSLASMFTYIEKPEAASGSSADITIDPNKQLAPVDYNSRITLEPNKNKIKDLLSKSGAQIQNPPADALDRLNHIPDVIKQAQTYLADVQAASTAVAAEAAQPDRAPGTALSAETSALVHKRAQEELTLLGFVETVARSRVKLEHPDYTEQQIKVAVSTIRSPLLFDDTGKIRVAFNVNAFGAFLNTEATWLAALTKSDHDQVVASAKLLRIRAQLVSLGKQPIPIHIDNYDNLIDANPTKEARLAFTMDNATKQRTDQELKTEGDLATITNQAKDPNSDLSKTLKQLGSAKTLKTLLDDLRTHLKSAAAPFTDTNSALIKGIIQSAIAATQDPGQKADLTALEQSLDKLSGPTGGIATLQNALSQLDDLKKQAADPAKLPDVVQKIAAAINAIPDTITEIKKDIPRIDTLLKVVPAVLQAKAAQTQQVFTDEVMKDLTAISATTLSDYPDLTQTIASFLSGVTGDSSAFAGNTTPSSYKSLPVDELVEGTIHLNETAVREGDQLDMKFEVFSTDPQTQTQKAVPDLQDRKDFRVEKFGLINTWSTSLAFARPMSGPGSSSFSAAPSLSWTLHYRPRISDDTDFGGKTWSCIDPGAGVNVEGLNFNNTAGTGVQVGVGGHVSVFHDLLQLGAGYNLSVSHDRGYVYVGIGVFQTLQQAGTLLSAARQ